MYLVLGLVFAPGIEDVVRVFPLPLLGVVLAFESIALMSLVRDVAADRTQLWIALTVALAVVGLPYGYVVGLTLGVALSYAAKRGLVVTPELTPTPLGATQPGGPDAPGEHPDRRGSPDP
jgi:hypothetical protein